MGIVKRQYGDRGQTGYYSGSFYPEVTPPKRSIRSYWRIAAVALLALSLAAYLIH